MEKVLMCPRHVCILQITDPTRTGSARGAPASRPLSSILVTCAGLAMRGRPAARVSPTARILRSASIRPVLPRVRTAQKERVPQKDATIAGTERLYAGLRESTVVSGQPHPDVLCESPVMQGVSLPVLPSGLQLELPSQVVDEAWLSSLQLECVTYAVKRFETFLPNGCRAGYCLGDGTGCGKGRVIAALIWHLWNRGIRRHVWVSISADLLKDAARDLEDLGAGVAVVNLGQLKSYGSPEKGSCKKVLEKHLGCGRDGVIFLTYSMLISAKGGHSWSLDPEVTRMGQLFEWFGKGKGEGLICFDEAHKAKNLAEHVFTCTKTGRRVLQLQRACSRARVLYSTATAATEVKHMAYMDRLGLWGPGLPYSQFADFKKAVERGGLSGMELVAMSMKAQGMLSCKTLSFHGVDFSVSRVKLHKQATEQYDAAAAFWQRLWLAFSTYLDRREGDTSWNGGCPAPAPQRRKRTSRWRALLLGLFWSTQQRFFKQLQVAAKVPTAVGLAKKALKDGNAVVFSMWSTAEARTRERMLSTSKADASKEGSDSDDALDVDGEGFLSGPRMMVEHFLERHMTYHRPSGSEVRWAKALVQPLQKELATLDLPPNPLDTLIDELGGPTKVAEMTGRSHRQERVGRNLEYVKRTCSMPKGASASAVVDAEQVNLQEQLAFQTGQKQIAVITEAASAGISLHSDRRYKQNGYVPKPRVMITVELPWAGDKAKQQFGRIHRSNQLFPPSFQLVITELAGEVRFVSAVTRRLILLGAMTKGDRSSSEALDALGDFDVHNRHGAYALEALCECLRSGSFRGSEGDLLCLKGAGRQWSSWAAFAKDASNKLKAIDFKLGFAERRQAGQSALQDPRAISRFLNRLLMLEVHLQKALFEAFFMLYRAAAEADQVSGEYADGAEQLHLLHGRRVRSLKVKSQEVVHKAADTGAATNYVQVRIDRGVSWEEAQEAACKSARGHPLEGFYLYSPPGKAGKEAVLVLARPESDLFENAQGSSGNCGLLVLRPHLGLSKRFAGKPVNAASLQQFKKCSTAASKHEAKMAWQRQFNASLNNCIHGQRGAECPEPGKCCLGSRIAEEHILTGNILSTWLQVASSLNAQRQTNDEVEHLVQRRMPMVRAVTDEHEVIVGVAVQPDAVEEVKYVLQALKAFPTASKVRSNKADADDDEQLSQAAHDKKNLIADQKRCHKFCQQILSDLSSASSRAWGTWCHVHHFLVKSGKASNAPEDLRAVQHAVGWLERAGAIQVDRKSRKTTLTGRKDSSPTPNAWSAAMLGEEPADGADMLKSWHAVLDLASGGTSKEAVGLARIIARNAQLPQARLPNDTAKERAKKRRKEKLARARSSEPPLKKQKQA
ncbi:unnamed protein product [Effrenium voratum]|nr:unnamed protein product [Effrenium voratum]